MSTPSILIVEDEAIVAVDLTKKLRRLGYMICGTLWRGEDVLARTRELRPDLILMDIRLAGRMDGIEVAERLRAEAGPPVIFLTAYSDSATLQRAKLTEPFGYILKPFAERELHSHIEIGLYRHRAEQKLRESEARLRHLNAELEERVLERTSQLRALTAELTLAEERERRRIAQVLHDNLQPLLVGAWFQIEGAKSRSQAKTRQDCLRNAVRLLDKATTVSHELSQELSPPSLHDFGLTEGLEWLGHWVRRKHELQVLVQSQGTPDLPENIKMLLFHSVRELLLNVARHAGVKKALVALALDEQRQIEILVADQGRGFDPERIQDYAGGNGLGLIGIRERLLRLGGRMEIQSGPGNGSQVRLIAPL